MKDPRSVVVADNWTGLITEGVQEPDCVSLGTKFADLALVCPAECRGSSLVVSLPPVIVQRKTGAMMPRVMFL